jgi:P pilus assembly chaperone PapD
MKYIYLSFLLLLSGAVHAAAGGINSVGSGLIIAPTKLIFKPGEAKSQVLTLINGGDEEATFRITSIYKKLNTDGSFSEIPVKEAENPLGNFLRFSPRQVTIAAGKSQTVRVMLRSASRFKEKEFAGRLLFRAIPDIKESTVTSDSESKEAGFILTALYGVSIPVLYWPEGVTASTTYTNLTKEIVGNKVNISLDLIREGTKSSYQDISVSWKNPDGKIIFLSALKGAAVYYPQTQRQITIESDATLINKAGQPMIELTDVAL